MLVHVDNASSSQFTVHAERAHGEQQNVTQIIDALGHGVAAAMPRIRLDAQQERAPVVRLYLTPSSHVLQLCIHLERVKRNDAVFC